MVVSVYKTQTEDSYHSLLLDYASGALDEAHALIMTTHMTLSPYARRLLNTYEGIGGALLHDACDPVAVSANARDTVMRRLDENAHGGLSSTAQPDPAAQPQAHTYMPRCLMTYIPQTDGEWPWKKTYAGLECMPIGTRCQKSKAELLKIAPGTKIPEHSHKGYEVTLVLDGAFHDESGTYSRGDIIITDDTVTHRPVADERMGCVCLVVTSAPPRLTGFLGRLLNPFLKF